jgi:ABC-2 type transport system ATP-binding protein
MIRIQNLSKSFGQQQAVRGIDLEIPTGQLVGLLGPNGAGKSTTIKMLTGMLAPTSGTAEIEGFDVVRQPLEVKRVVGYVPESGALFEALTATEYLKFVASLYHIPDAEADQRIARFARFFDLAGTDLTDKPLSAFSKGMRQKVVITSALLHNPKVVFFDEPLNGLDANAALSFKTLITSLARDGKTIIYCSHILDVVERVCERVAFMKNGRIDAIEVLREGENAPATPALLRVRLRLSIPRDGAPTPGEIAHRTGAALVESGAGWAVCDVTGDAGSARLARAFLEGGYELHELRPEAGRLERLFAPGAPPAPAAAVTQAPSAEGRP